MIGADDVTRCAGSWERRGRLESFKLGVSLREAAVRNTMGSGASDECVLREIRRGRPRMGQPTVTRSSCSLQVQPKKSIFKQGFDSMTASSSINVKVRPYKDGVSVEFA